MQSSSSVILAFFHSFDVGHPVPEIYFYIWTTIVTLEQELPYCTSKSKEFFF